MSLPDEYCKKGHGGKHEWAVSAQHGFRCRKCGMPQKVYLTLKYDEYPVPLNKLDTEDYLIFMASSPLNSSDCPKSGTWKHNWSALDNNCIDCGVSFETWVNLRNAELAQNGPTVEKKLDPKCECGVSSIKDSYERHSAWCPIKE